MSQSYDERRLAGSLDPFLPTLCKQETGQRDSHALWQVTSGRFFSARWDVRPQLFPAACFCRADVAPT